MQNKPSSHTIVTVLIFLAEQNKAFMPPLSDLIIEQYGKDPFLMLIGCLLSLRARDKMTFPICVSLFAHARTAQALLALPISELEAILKPIGFYRKKSTIIRTAARYIGETYGGKVPSSYEQLIAIPGVGPKTAAFMLCYVFGEPALCVDTHVHRLSNRFGWIKTASVKETQKQLEGLVPRDMWTATNRILVTWGQNECPPRLARSRQQKHDRLCPCAHGGHMPPLKK